MGLHKEKRQYNRVDIDFSINIKGKDENGYFISLEIGKSINISASGILVHHNKPLPLGTIVQATFLKPNSFDFFKNDGKVIRIDINPDGVTYDIGIEFIDLSKQNAETLNYYLTWNGKKEK